VLLEPLARFDPIVDLRVDRGRGDAALGRAGGGLGVASARSAPEGGANEALRVALAGCVGCGACFEACPETGRGRAFVGPEAIGRNRLGRLHPHGGNEAALLATMSAEGGVADCGKAQACVDVCPVGVPLVEAIADAAAETSSAFLFGWMRR
jgi:succinate dehydrogenase / fumarate reductase iron-sulfur subunit